MDPEQVSDDIDLINKYLYITDEVETRQALMNLLKVLRAWKKTSNLRTNYNRKKYRI